jgi:NAD+ kinase
VEIRNVGLIVKRNDPQATGLAQRVIKYILDNTSWGINVPLSDCVDIPNYTRVNTHLEEDMCRYSDILIVLGGDGTMLQAASYTLPNKSVPVLGINLGRVGYLSTIPPESVFDELDKLSSGFVNVYAQRKMLCVNNPEKNGVFYPVLNEVVLHWSQKARLINLFLSIQGDGQFEVRADGIIISTPTGSTAYNYAAGGPLVHHDVGALIVTPICPFSGLKGSLMLPMSSTLKINSDERNSQVSVTIDGYRDFPLKSTDTLYIEEYPTPFVLLNPRISSYLEVLQTKLNVVGHGTK